MLTSFAGLSEKGSLDDEHAKLSPRDVHLLSLSFSRR